MQSIQEVVNCKIEEMINSGSLQEKIEQSVDGAVSRAIEGQFSRHGSIQKQIEKIFEDGLKINQSAIDFQSYNAVIAAAVKQKVAEQFKSDSSSILMQELDKVLETAPKEIDIHTLISKVCEMWTEEYEDYYHWNNEATVELTERENGGTLGERFSLKLKIESSRSYNYHVEKELHLYILDGKIRINHRHEFNPTCLSSVEAFIFKLYAAGTTVTGAGDFDECECDLSVTPNDCY